MNGGTKKIFALIDKNRLALRKSVWRRFNNHAPNARAAFVFGAQRSGTTLLLACLDKSMEIEVLGEESRAMKNYRIRSDEEIREIVRTSPHKVVLFKPLTDSHKARHFLALCGASSGIWAYRRAADRAYSAVQKFGDHNLQVLSALASGKMLDSWQAQGLTETELGIIRSFDYADLSAQAAAAVFWLIRNSLFFSNGLEKEDKVLPVAYEDIVSDPQGMIRGICRFIGCEYDHRMTDDVHAKSVGRKEVDIPPSIIEMCDGMYDRLKAVQQKRWGDLFRESEVPQ